MRNLTINGQDYKLSFDGSDSLGTESWTRYRAVLGNVLVIVTFHTQSLKYDTHHHVEVFMANCGPQGGVTRGTGNWRTLHGDFPDIDAAVAKMLPELAEPWVPAPVPAPVLTWAEQYALTHEGLIEFDDFEDLTV